MRARDPRLPALLEIATLLAEQAVAELADATRACTEIEAQLSMLQRRTDELRQHPETPETGAQLARLRQLGQADRAALLQVLARRQAQRLTIMERARRAEGRRQALAKLSDQVS